MRTEHAPQGKPLEEFLLAATLLTAIAAVWALPGCETAKPGAEPAPTAARPAPKAPLEPTEPTAEEAARIDAALAVAEVGDYELALASFRELLADNPTLTEAHLGMANVLEQSGDLDRAERSFARAATLDRESYDAQSGHGRVLMALERYNDAVRAWHKALVVRPESVEANVGMASAFLGLGQPQTALSFAERAVRNDPQSGPARLELARTYERIGRTDEAIRAYEIALELNEPDDQILTGLVKLFCAAKRYAEAANASEELIKIAPSPNAYERLGWARFRLGEYEKSMEAYRKGVALDPNHWPSLNGVGTNAMNKWLTSGKKDDDSRIEARRSFQKSIKVNPDQPKVIAILTQYRP